MLDMHLKHLASCPPLSSLITRCSSGDKRHHQPHHLLYLVAFVGQEGRSVAAVGWKHAHSPFSGEWIIAYLRGCSSIVELWCVFVEMSSDMTIFDLLQAFGMSVSSVFCYFLKAVVCLCDCFHRNHNLWKYTTSDIRYPRNHGNTCLTSRINIGFFFKKPKLVLYRKYIFCR